MIKYHQFIVQFSYFGSAIPSNTMSHLPPLFVGYPTYELRLTLVY